MHACGVCSDRALVTGSVVELPLPAGVWVVLARRSVTVLWYVSPPCSVPVVWCRGDFPPRTRWTTRCGIRSTTRWTTCATSVSSVSYTSQTSWTFTSELLLYSTSAAVVYLDIHTLEQPLSHFRGPQHLIQPIDFCVRVVRPRKNDFDQVTVAANK